MGKIHRDISIDEDVYNEFLRYVGKGNVSSRLQEFMENFNTISKNNVEEINTQLVKLKINELESTISKAKAELNLNVELLEKSQKLAADMEVKRLEESKAKIKSIEKCINCDREIKDGSVRTAIGNICKSCFRCNSDRTKFSLWFPAEKKDTGGETNG